jgi:hypothetical protein
MRLKIEKTQSGTYYIPSLLKNSEHYKKHINDDGE